MHGLVVIEGMNLSGHPWIINKIGTWKMLCLGKVFKGF